MRKKVGVKFASTFDHSTDPISKETGVPTDELVTEIELSNCSVCGKEPDPTKIGGFDLEEVVDGVAKGKTICYECMEKGH